MRAFCSNCCGFDVYGTSRVFEAPRSVADAIVEAEQRFINASLLIYPNGFFQCA
jgi:hypothetical protein